MSNIVQYGSYEPEAAQAEQEALDRTGQAFMKFKVGKNYVRILPPPLGKKSPFRVVWQHGNEVGGEFRSVPCPRYEAKLDCPACRRADQLKASSNPADQERAKELFAKRRIYCNVINREEPDAGPIVMAFGKQIHEALVALRTDPDAGGDYTHPETGFDIIIERKGTGKNDTEYKVFAARKATPLGNMNWIAEQGDLEQFGKILSPEDMRAKLSGKPIESKASEKTVNAAPSKPAATRTVEQDTGNNVPAADDDVSF